ncbi:hypothetical protein ABTN50_20005, partial [Acinetobacter baumannii]
EQQMGGAGEEAPSDGSRPNYPDFSAFRNAPQPTYHPYTTGFDEVVQADDLCDTDELNRLRNHLDQQLRHLQTVVGRLANRLQRR